MSDSNEDTIQLDQFLKLNGVVASGGEAKHLIKSGEVFVNGQVETRRGRKLKVGDTVKIKSQIFKVEKSE
jgi:ribosome-associated protein